MKRRKKFRWGRLVILLLALCLLAVTLLMRWMQAQEEPLSVAVEPAREEARQETPPTAAPTPEPTLAPTLEPTPEPTPEPVRYTIDENALSGPAPDPAAYGETDDPAVIEALLATEQAQALIGGQTIAWSAEIERFPNTPIRWYLDDTILVLVWQEVTAQAQGTFSEVFVADGSQFRRKISADTLWSFEFETTTSFAKKANAVLTFGGDFYYHERACGIGVYQREIYRFEPETADTCFVTADGDLLFVKRGEMRTQEEAEAFVAENDVLFSLCFGPVIIENGEDVQPYDYMWGEINENYARSVLGQMGERHYLLLNINHGGVGTEYYYLTPLRRATEAMLEKGVQKAYALDGGQTATTVLGGELVNLVQFGWQKDISDVIYFATAIPEK